jgi:hypothetical protein
MVHASLQDEARVREAGYAIERFDGSDGTRRVRGWLLLDIGDRAPLMIGNHGCVSPTRWEAVAEGLRRIELG